MADAAAEVLGAWRGAQLVAVASLRPTLVIESGIERSVLEPLLGPLSDLGAGLVRSEVDGVAALWDAARGARPARAGRSPRDVARARTRRATRSIRRPPAP